MEQYVVYGFIPYEGWSEVFSGDREEVKAFIKGPQCYYDLDDLHIYSTDAPDVYALYHEK